MKKTPVTAINAIKKPGSNNCSYTNCKNSIEFICKCSPQGYYLCRMHQEEHVKIKGANHKIESFWIILEEEIKQKVLKFLTDQKIKYQEAKQAGLKLFTESIDDAANILKENTQDINKQISKIEKYSLMVLKTDKVSKNESEDFLKSLASNCEVMLEKIKSLLNTDSSVELSKEFFICKISKDFNSFSINLFEKKLENLNRIKYECLENELKDLNQNLNEEEVKKELDLIRVKLEKFENVFNEKIRDLEGQVKNYWKENNAIVDGILKRISKNSIGLSSITVIEKINFKLKEILNYENIVDNLYVKYTSDFLEFLRSVEDYKKLKSNFERNFQFIFNSTFNSEDENKNLRTLLKFSKWVKLRFSQYIQIYNCISGKLKMLLHQCDFDTRYLYNIFRYNELTHILIYDIENQNEQDFTISTPEPLNSSTFILNLPNFELFCYGTSYSLYPFSPENENCESGFACILDLQTYSMKKILPEGKECNKAGGLYWNRAIYIFGGKKGNNSLTLAEKFDLVESEWKSLNPLPAPIYGCSCALFNGEILICGCDLSSIIKYDIEKNTYSSILLLNLSASFKIIFCDDKNAYIIDSNGKIYQNEYPIW